MAMAVVSFVAIALLAAVLTPSTNAQTQTPSCVSKLVPCAAYLNGTTTPPATCCGPLKQAVKDDLPCLCSLFTNKDLLKSFNIDINQALLIPKHCNITQDQSICKSSAAPGNAAAPSSTNGTTGPASKNPKNDNNASHGLPAISFPSMIGLLLLLLFINA